ncbi:MAG TPA: CDP-alcohol phosphatidyltransferase family protein [Solirubrobacteraceae bacterium]|nr:CDP-alcohol phosphatidyltransferase family protein [Solirubrobacteraceae bacterium]
MRTSRPSIAELRAATQPASIFERNSGEHWAGKLYVRRFSPYLTRLLIGTPLTPNGVTWLMILSGVGAAALLAVDGVLPAVGAVLLIQLQILFDCSDGELARWRGQSSPVGIYLDRLGHWVTEAALPIALGIRAGEPTLGLAVAVLVLFVKGETALVHVARAEAGLGKVEDSVAVAAPRGGLLAALRRGAAAIPFYRAFVAIEFTALALVAAILDEERTLLWVLLPVAAITALGHLVAILTSRRLR